jgi:hypothetical protein
MISPRKRVCTALVGLLAVSLTGCSSGGPQYANVSGVVTFNGKPYKSGIVKFQPVGTKDNPNPGRGSYAHTDENGRFKLVVDDKITGATIGKHRVFITTVRESRIPDPDPALGTPDGSAKVQIDPIPAEWNSSSTKEFDVPAAGTDKANFDIVGKKK